VVGYDEEGLMSSRESQRAATPRQVFGGMLRFYRERAGLSRTELARAICKSESLVGAIETGDRAPTPQVTVDLEAALSTDGVLPRLRDEIGNGLSYQTFPAWFADWPGIEISATRLRWFEPLVIPGLLQTEEYMRSIFRTRFGATDDEIDEQVAARLKRQEILERDQPPLLWVILDEAVLHRQVGGRHVMAEQVDRLIEAAQRPYTMIQVIPASVGAHEGLQCHFVIADFHDAPSVAYQDTALRGQVIEDSADVASLAMLWDTLSGDTLSRAASLALLEEVKKSWALAVSGK
jgi:transcriptional regulator with XRE-family HTH domain